MLSGKNIAENTIAIFFAFLSMMILIGLLYFFYIVDISQEIVERQNKAILELHIYTDEQINILEKQTLYQQSQIEILRTQLSQLRPLKRK